MIELRGYSKGLYKGLIYCTSIDEVKYNKQARCHILERSDLKPIFTVKRGCTEFTNVHKEYGEIGNLENLHQGEQQRREWKINEEQFLGEKNDTTKSYTTGWEFNLGELLIFKNWILYAIAMNDSAAIAKYGNIKYENETVSKAIELKKISTSKD